MTVKYQGAALAGINTTFLTKFTAAVAAIGGTKVKVISGYRKPGVAFKNLYGQIVSGSPTDPHAEGIALDSQIYIPGKGWIPAGTALKNVASQYGLRSGDQPNFYEGQPDPNHVDMATNPTTPGANKTAPSGRLSYQQIEAVWEQAGGSKALAPTMAAIALAESKGDPNAHNNNPATGDDSYGLWQINYYGNMREARTREFGPPSGMFNPATNAAAAVTLARGGAGLSNWSTFNNGSFESYMPGGDKAGGAGNPITNAKNSLSSAGSFFSDPFGIDAGLTSVGKDIMYVTVILGGGAMVVLGLLLVGIDLGLSTFGAKKLTPAPVRAVARVTRRKGDAEASRGGEVTRTGNPEKLTRSDKRQTKRNETARVKVKKTASSQRDKDYGKDPPFGSKPGDPDYFS